MLIALALHVALAFQDPAPAEAAVLRAAVAEAAAIWAPYGLALEGAAVCSGPGGCPLVVAVDIAGTSRSGRVGVVLGSIVFDPDGVPEPRVTLFLGQVRRFVTGARLLEMAEWQWPPQLREEVIGRVLGRVLAHEIGHYVLRSRQHASGGLMRSLQQPGELAALSRAGFKLSTAEAAQLRSR